MVIPHRPPALSILRIDSVVGRGKNLHKTRNPFGLLAWRTIYIAVGSQNERIFATILSNVATIPFVLRRVARFVWINASSIRHQSAIHPTLHEVRDVGLLSV